MRPSRRGARDATSREMSEWFHIVEVVPTGPNIHGTAHIPRLRHGLASVVHFVDKQEYSLSAEQVGRNPLCSFVFFVPLWLALVLSPTAAHSTTSFPYATPAASPERAVIL